MMIPFVLPPIATRLLLVIIPHLVIVPPVRSEQHGSPATTRTVTRSGLFRNDEDVREITVASTGESFARGRDGRDANFYGDAPPVDASSTGSTEDAGLVPASTAAGARLIQEHRGGAGSIDAKFLRAETATDDGRGRVDERGRRGSASEQFSPTLRRACYICQIASDNIQTAKDGCFAGRCMDGSGRFCWRPMGSGVSDPSKDKVENFG